MSIPTPGRFNTCQITERRRNVEAIDQFITAYPLTDSSRPRNNKRNMVRSFVATYMITVHCLLSLMLTVIGCNDDTYIIQHALLLKNIQKLPEVIVGKGNATVISINPARKIISSTDMVGEFDR